MSPPDPHTRRTPGPTTARALIKTDTAEGHRKAISFGPVEEIELRVEASIGMLTKALLTEVEIIVAVEAAIVSLEQAARFLRVVRR